MGFGATVSRRMKLREENKGRSNSKREKAGAERLKTCRKIRTGSGSFFYLFTSESHAESYLFQTKNKRSVRKGLHNISIR